MNPVFFSDQSIALFLWVVSTLYVFLGEALKSYLLHYRYRELKEGSIPERMKLGFLFSIVDDADRYRRNFSNILAYIAVAVSGASWVWWVLKKTPELLPWEVDWVVRLVMLVILLFSATMHGLILKWLPFALGHRFSVPLIQAATIYIVFVSFLLRPLRAAALILIRILNGIGLKEPVEPEPLDRDIQILAIGREDVKVTTVTEKIASRAMELNSISVYDILLPRNQVQFFDLNENVSTNLELARKTGHTRFPLCVGDLDNCEGLIHIKDIFRLRRIQGEIDFRKISRPILRVGQDEPLDKILQVLLTKRVHMALVEDEFGGILGVLTLERILEELVGEIQDEFDKEDKMIVAVKKDYYKISGLTPLHEVEDQLGVDDLENDEVSSFGGLISHHLGRIPSNGEQIEIGPLMITIKETDDTRVISTMVRVMSLPDELNAI